MKDKLMSVRLPDELRDWLRGEAQTNRRSVNSELVVKLEAHRRVSADATARLGALMMEGRAHDAA